MIFARIRKLGKGAVFSPRSFLDLGSRSAVDVAMHRLARNGDIRRLSRGLYDYPRTHAELGPLSPSIENIASALAQRGHLHLMPAGDYAANLLRLSDQVPAKIVFLTDGASRRIMIGSREIILKHTTPRNMAAAGRKSGLIIQALRHLGRAHITPERIAAIRPLLSKTDRLQLSEDIGLAPAWMHPYMSALQGGTN